MPSTTRAATFSIVCETIVPITTGVVSRGPACATRDDQGARGLTEARRQRRGHQHADRGSLEGVHARDRPIGQPDAQDREPRERAQHHRGAHHGERREDPRRARAQQARGDPVHPDALQRDRGQAEAADGGDGERAATGGAAQPRVPVPALGRGLERGHAARRHGGPAVGRGDREAAGETARGRRGRAVQRAGARLDRLLVDADDLGGDLRPGVAARVLGRGGRPSRRGARATAPARGASRRGRWRRRAGRGCRRGRRGRRRGSRRCRSRRPACPARTPP